MVRQPIKPELTTRELYDILKIDYIFYNRGHGGTLSIVLYDNSDISINYQRDEMCRDDLAKMDKDRVFYALSTIGENYTLPPFESNFIDRSKL